MPSIRKPRALKRGATLGIAAPAGPIDRERLEAGESMLQKLGFETRSADDITREEGYLAGSDERRAEEFMSLVNDPEVDGIVCARGGYGCHRIIAHLDADAVRKRAKPLMGYSDITTLLLWQLKKAGLMGFHGPMLDRPETLSADSKRAISTALQGQGAPPRIAGQPMQRGWGEGRLVGGSLKLLVASLGTPWEVDLRDSILVFEDTNEAPYSIDRMLMQLICAGKLESIVGIGIGGLTDCTNPTRPRPTAHEVCEELLVPLGVPIVRDLPFGHLDENTPFALGCRAAIDGDRGEIELLETPVAKR